MTRSQRNPRIRVYVLPLNPTAASSSSSSSSTSSSAVPDPLSMSVMIREDSPRILWFLAMELHAHIVEPRLATLPRPLQLSRKASFRQSLVKHEIFYRHAERFELEALKAHGQLSAHAPSSMLIKSEDAWNVLSIFKHDAIKDALRKQVVEIFKRPPFNLNGGPIQEEEEEEEQEEMKVEVEEREQEEEPAVQEEEAQEEPEERRGQDEEEQEEDEEEDEEKEEVTEADDLDVARSDGSAEGDEESGEGLLFKKRKFQHTLSSPSDPSYSSSSTATSSTQEPRAPLGFHSFVQNLVTSISAPSSSSSSSGPPSEPFDDESPLSSLAFASSSYAYSVLDSEFTPSSPSSSSSSLPGLLSNFDSASPPQSSSSSSVPSSSSHHIVSSRAPSYSSITSSTFPFDPALLIESDLPRSKRHREEHSASLHPSLCSSSSAPSKRAQAIKRSFDEEDEKEGQEEHLNSSDKDHASSHSNLPSPFSFVDRRSSAPMSASSSLSAFQAASGQCQTLNQLWMSDRTAFLTEAALEVETRHAEALKAMIV